MTSSGRRKRASATGQKGAIGETFVKGVFEDMLWGPVPVSEHDTGSDFFVQVRDHDLTELGLLLGVQVKNEQEYFSEKGSAKARKLGWWEYRAKQDDTEYWLDHAIPHVLVLYDQESRNAFWGQVTREAVRWTPKGARIQVPVGNTLDPSSRDQLLSIAAQSRRSVAWTPATWKGLAALPPARRLRTALLAPRVAVPRGVHPKDSVTPEAALAELMLGKFPGRRARPKREMPSEEHQQNGAFAWRLHHAVWSVLTTGEPERLDALAAGPTEPYERVALLAVRTTFRLENGNPRAALSLLDDVDERDLVDPVDRAWLDAHRARCLLELGDAEAAHELALKVAATGLLNSHDHGAVALRAAALNSTLLAERTPATDLQAAVTASDSPPVWWRDQHRAWALTEVLDRTFKQWARHTSSHPKTDTDAWDRLRGVTLSAGMTADLRAWRVAASELARYELSTSDLGDADRVAACLDDMRNCGDEEALSQAVSHLILEGPIEPLRRLTQHIDASAATHTNLGSTLELMKEALEVLDDATLDQHMRWALHQLQNPDGANTMGRSYFWIAEEKFIPTLRKGYRLLNRPGQTMIRHHLVTMEPVKHQLHAKAYANLIRSIPHDDWAKEELRILEPRAKPPPSTCDTEFTPFGDHRYLGRAYNAVLAHNGDSDRLASLHAQLAEGKWSALEDIGDIGDIPDQIIEELIPHLIRDLDQRAGLAARGIFAHPEVYSGEVLLIVNCTHPHRAQWEPIQRALEGGAVKWDQALLARRLSGEADRIDEAVIRRLEPGLTKMAHDHDDVPPFDPLAGEAARIALLELTTRVDDPRDLHAALLAGPSGRRAVAHAIGRRRTTTDVALLTSLATDGDSSVRSASAGAAATWQQHHPHPTVQALLDSLLQEGGYANAYATMRAIKHQQHNVVVHGILEKLSAHPSARIRWRAHELLDDPENCRCGGD